jgi:hypothetical protein
MSCVPNLLKTPRYRSRFTGSGNPPWPLRSAVENIIRTSAVHGGSDMSVSLLEEGSSAVISVQDSGDIIARNEGAGILVEIRLLLDAKSAP